MALHPPIEMSCREYVRERLGKGLLDPRALSPETRARRRKNRERFERLASKGLPPTSPEETARRLPAEAANSTANQPTTRKRPVAEVYDTVSRETTRGEPTVPKGALGFRTPPNPVECSAERKLTVLTNVTKNIFQPDGLTLLDWRKRVEFNGKITPPSGCAPVRGTIKGTMQCGVPAEDSWSTIGDVNVDETGHFFGIIPEGKLPNNVQVRRTAMMTRVNPNPIHLRVLFVWTSANGCPLTCIALSVPISAKTARQHRADHAVPSKAQANMMRAVKRLKGDESLLAHVLASVTVQGCAEDPSSAVPAEPPMDDRKVDMEYATNLNKDAASLEEAGDRENDVGKYKQAAAKFSESIALMKCWGSDITCKIPYWLPACEARLGGVFLKLGDEENGKILIQKGIDGLRLGGKKTKAKADAAQRILDIFG